MKKKIVGIVLVVLVFLVIGVAFVCEKNGVFNSKDTGTNTGNIVTITPPPFTTSDVPVEKSTKLVTPLPTPEGGYNTFITPTSTPSK